MHELCCVHNISARIGNHNMVHILGFYFNEIMAQFMVHKLTELKSQNIDHNVAENKSITVFNDFISFSFCHPATLQSLLSDYHMYLDILLINW